MSRVAIKKSLIRAVKDELPQTPVQVGNIKITADQWARVDIISLKFETFNDYRSYANASGIVQFSFFSRVATARKDQQIFVAQGLLDKFTLYMASIKNKMSVYKTDNDQDSEQNSVGLLRFMNPESFSLIEDKSTEGFGLRYNVFFQRK